MNLFVKIEGLDRERQRQKIEVHPNAGMKNREKACTMTVAGNDSGGVRYTSKETWSGKQGLPVMTAASVSERA